MFRKLIGTMTLCLLAACTRKPSSSSRISIQIPTSTQLKAKMISMDVSAIDPSMLCFGVNVAGPGITDGTPACDIDRGATAGMVPPGGLLSVQVPEGKDRLVELYGYLRASGSTSCPNVFPGISSPLWNEMYLVGKVDSVSIDQPVVDVDVTLNLPASLTDTVVAQQSWPSTCLAGNQAPSKSGFVPLTSEKQNNSSYILSGRMEIQNGMDLNNGTYHLRGKFLHKAEGGSP